MKNVDDIINRIKQTKFKREVTHANTWQSKVAMYWNSTVKFWTQVGRGLYWIHNKITWPITKLIAKPGKWLYRKYQNLWFWWVYSVNEYGVKKFSVSKAGMMILATGLFFWTVPGASFDWFLYVTTAKHHIAYLNASQEVHGSHNVFNARGCDDTPVCSEQDTVYYRVNPDLFNQLWSFYKHHSWFLPDYVAAAVKPTTHRCEILTYGIRWKWLIRNWDIYPDLLEAKCYPLNAEGK